MADSETAAGVNPAIDDPKPHDPKPHASAAAQMSAFDDHPAEAPDPDDPDVDAKTLAQSSDASATPFSPPVPDETEPTPTELTSKGVPVAEPRTQPVKAQPSRPSTAEPPSDPSSQPTPSYQQEDLRNRQATAALTPSAIIASAVASHIQRPQTQSQPQAPATPSPPASAAQSLLDRFAVKRILDTLRPTAQANAPAPTLASAGAPANPPMQSMTNPRPATPPTPDSSPSTTLRNASQSDAVAPAGSLRDKLGAFTANRMQARRDAEQVQGAAQAAAGVLASLQAVEQQETTGILTKVRDAAKANGGIENVLSEMRPGGQFEDLRKEFNVVLSHDEGFAAAYQKATSAITSYAETRVGVTAASQTRADPNLARLETLDQEIAEAAKKLPGVADGKSAFDDLVENGREAVQKLFSNVQQFFNRDANVRGPSPSPGFGS